MRHWLGVDVVTIAVAHVVPFIEAFMKMAEYYHPDKIDI